MITNTLELRMTPGGISPFTHVSQYETGARTFEFRLYDGDTEYPIPAGASVTLYGRRPDGVGFSTPCAVVGSRLLVVVSADMTACAGKVECELELVSGDTRVSTENFYLLVERAAYRTGGS